MKHQHEGNTLRVRQFVTLNSKNAIEFQRQTTSQLEPSTKFLAIDMSQVGHLDCFGLGILIALRDLMERRGGQLRLIDPSPPARQFMELTRVNRLLKIQEGKESSDAKFLAAHPVSLS